MSEITQPSVKSYRDTFAEFRQPVQGLPLPTAADGGGKLNVLIEVTNPLVRAELDPANPDRRGPRGRRARGRAGVSRLESSYYDYMGFDPEKSRAALSQYVQYFTGHSPVVELASGRGEFLALLAAAGIEAYGVDDDEGVVERTRADGREVVPGDAVTYLETMVEPGSVGGVFSAHFFEHLVPADVERVLAGVRRALRPGGVVVTVVPNPACHAVQSVDFWRDPTHVRFYDPSLLSFFCSAAGLEVVHVGGNPRNHPGPPPHLYADLPTVDPRLGDSVGELVLRSAVDRRGRPDPHSPWRTFGHLLGTLDERLQVLQDQTARLARAHNALLEQLYPPNEVYVVAHG